MRIVRGIAAQRQQTLGKVISDLLREMLTPKAPTITRNGFPLFEHRQDGGVVTDEHVNRIKNSILDLSQNADDEE